MAKKIAKKQTKTKKAVKTVRKGTKKPLEAVEFELPRASAAVQKEDVQNPQKSRQSWLVLAGLFLLVVLVYLYRSGYLVAATVNGKPIFRWQLNTVLTERFGAQTLEMMITEKLIEDEANSKGVTTNAQDIKKRQDAMLARIGGGVSLDDLLKFQGMTKGEFDKQVKLQLTVEKILEKQTPVTDAEITQFISTSSAQLKASDEAQLKEEARQMILEQRIGEKIGSWYNDLKSKASIKKYL